MKFKACILISNIDCKLLQYVRNVHNTAMTLKISNAMTNIYNSEHYSSIFKRHSERNKSAKQIDVLNYLSTLKFFSIICLPTTSFQFSRRTKSFFHASTATGSSGKLFLLHFNLLLMYI